MEFICLRDEWDGAQILLGLCISYFSYHCDPIPDKKQQEVGRTDTGSQFPGGKTAWHLVAGACDTQFLAPQQVMEQRQ